MSKVLTILKTIKDYFLVVVIGFLLITIYFKNNKIDKLTTQLNEKPKVEYVYSTQIDTFKTPAPKPKVVIKYEPKDSLVYVPLDLTSTDSAQIALAYIKLYNLYGETKIYDDVIKDDSTAYIRLQEKVQFSTIKDRNLIFEDRTPVVRITDTKNIYTTSIVGGIEVGMAGVEIGGGLITKRNTFYKVSCDPYNKTMRGGAYFAIFNFKNK